MSQLLQAMAALLFFLASCGPSKQSASLTETEVTNMVYAKEFTFRADQMMPTGGRSRMLTEAYLFKVSPQELSADLPYMGRAFTANISTTDGGMRFTSRDFSYQQNPGKKNSWTVTINPRDQSDVRECILTIQSNGTADLSINSNKRQPIRYNGHIQPNTK
jgi:Domain of unknown function (DUF4251)